jgi:ubiquinol-cytochrome c reductase iron-sulfur subunit
VTAVGGGAGGAGGDDEGMRILEVLEPPASPSNDLIVIGAAVAAGVGGVAFAALLLAGAPLVAYGTALGGGLLALGVAVRRFFTDRFSDVWAAEVRAPVSDRLERSDAVLETRALPRRSLLVRVLAAAGGVLGLSLLAPVVSLGPAPGPALRQTAWRAGTRLVTSGGEPITPAAVAAGGIATVWPEHAVGDEISAVILVRLSAGLADAPTNTDWVIDGDLLAYSKVCTHAGCPVALFRERENALFCPCHQSTFDARRGAEPTFGPAARRLPQLPLGVDAEGHLVALGDFVEQVGPAFG